MSVYYDDRESRTVEERIEDQDTLLARMVRRGYRKSMGLRRMLDDLGIDPRSIRSREDLTVLPVLSRERLVEMQMADPPYGGLADKEAAVDRIFTSPGPVYEPHLSESDPLWARAYYAAGIRKGDVVLNAFSYHMVAAGLTFHAGLRRIGATVVPSGTSSGQLQVQLMRDLGVTAYTGTPSFLMAIIKKAEEEGHTFEKDFRLRRACFAAEPLQPALRKIFEERYGIETFQMYGATEVGDVAFECCEKRGWHICEEVIVEIVDPATGKRTDPGQLGEVVVTRFNKVFFLLRFGTGDLSRMIVQKCPCGRTSYLLDGIAGRVGDAIKIRGLFVAPSQLKTVQGHFEGIRFQLIVSRSGHEDHLTLRIEPKEPPVDRSALTESFTRIFREICTVRIDKIEYLEPGTFPADFKSIVDHRSWA
ncbi:MAG: AMP-binding protein [Deltaproteobacteria bacterium]|nr:AMP-binding protein [Deltaproteobacteria bacterium]